LLTGQVRSVPTGTGRNGFWWNKSKLLTFAAAEFIFKKMQKKPTLARLEIGERARISALDAEAIPSKFLEMGLLPGNVVEVRQKAPFNGPISLHVHGANALVAIRRSEAEHILVEQ